ncbi:MAG TPA: hypothetical protein VMH87_16985 [Pseudomonadales bacterium]|nr:hypothetical protein [Pseudomonadales bacterium]
MPKPKVERSYYRNGQLREEISSFGRKLHGPYRTWHPNGKPAFEAFYEHGLLHGLCRQWNDRGKLLGSFRIAHGTGIRRDWFQSGQLQFETSLVNGFFTGRMRSWLRDGSLAFESYAIKNRNVSQIKYHAVARRHPEYLRYPTGKVRLRTEEELDKREFELHVKSLLSRRNRCEAREWLKSDARQRSLGLLNFSQARQLVENLYDAKAQQVIVVNLYKGKAGKQFSDALLVKMPAAPEERRRIRQLLTKFPRKLRAAVLPETDDQSEYVFASFL